MPSLAARALSFLAPVALVTGLCAQGTIPLNGSWRIGALGSYFDQLPGCPFGPIVLAEVGQFTFLSNGTFQDAFTFHEVCTGGASFTGADGESGNYHVDSRGVLQLDYNPAAPGTDVEDFYIRPDGDAIVHGRDVNDDELWTLIALRNSSGHSASSLSGGYHVARLRNQNATGLTVLADLGTMTFDGAGGWSESGRRHTTLPNANSGTALYNGSGTYVVSSTGGLTLLSAGNLEVGGISPDADVFFSVRQNGNEVGLTVGVRQGANVDMGAVTGRWGFSKAEQKLGPPITFASDFGILDIDTTSPATGLFQTNGFAVSTTASTTTTSPSSHTGQLVVQGDGSLQLLQQAVPSPLEGAVSANGTFMILQGIEPGGAFLTFGLHQAAVDSYGAPTPGSASLPPLMLAENGFPMAGNASFALRIRNGLGGAAAAVAFALAPAPGLPLLGGQFYLDPALMPVVLPLSLGGPPGFPGAGDALLPMPIPPLPQIAGMELFTQTLVLDPGAPGGVSMSAGTRIEFSR